MALLSFYHNAHFCIKLFSEALKNKDLDLWGLSIVIVLQPVTKIFSHMTLHKKFYVECTTWDLRIDTLPSRPDYQNSALKIP